MKRNITENERTLITKFADKLELADRERLRQDLQNAYVCEEAIDGCMIKFAISGYERPTYLGQHAYGVEAKLAKKGGGELSVVLYADQNGHLLELEIINWEGNEAVDPDWNSLTIY